MSRIDQSRHYLRVARIRLKHLCYSFNSKQPDDCISCSTSDLEHHVPAVIQPTEYYEALRINHVTAQQLHQVGIHPKLSLSESSELRCLHGYYRLKTAKRDPNRLEEWWLVDLYSSGKACIRDASKTLI
jgi:hypothetical protein